MPRSSPFFHSIDDYLKVAVETFIIAALPVMIFHLLKIYVLDHQLNTSSNISEYGNSFLFVVSFKIIKLFMESQIIFISFALFYFSLVSLNSMF